MLTLPGLANETYALLDATHKQRWGGREFEDYIAIAVARGEVALDPVTHEYPDTAKFELLHWFEQRQLLLAMLTGEAFHRKIQQVVGSDVMPKGDAKHIAVLSVVGDTILRSPRRRSGLYMTTEKLGVWTGLSESTARKTLREVQDAGLLLVVQDATTQYPCIFEPGDALLTPPIPPLDAFQIKQTVRNNRVAADKAKPKRSPKHTAICNHKKTALRLQVYVPEMVTVDEGIVTTVLPPDMVQDAEFGAVEMTTTNDEEKAAA